MIICVVGPTGSGKSKLAERLSILYDALIVNFDAFQVYKEMNIGTAKPTADELKSGRYFLYDFIEPFDEFDVSKYQKMCRKFIDDHKDKNLILVGGTGLYLKATLFNYKFDEEEKMPDDFLREKSNDELYDELFKIDQEDALKITRNNRKRLLRALYIYKVHGKSKTEMNQNGKNDILYDNVYFIGLNYDREFLYDLINKRVDTMFELGLESEVKTLFNKYGSNAKSLQAIGYKEFTISEDKEIVKDLIKKNTRNYAKRQLTFFKHQFNNIFWFDSIEKAYEYAKENIK